ncbi:protein of unknown function [Paraburkholderia dioscoreae]|uniref:Uncharacterized protein n=1 Tax=Paraburkholderia dioscoreae TaxID=2604047 RepID=A0A5Q4ZP00_9BURK|nr:protein of unknown function [Paraburkholderia dioscoreae]
MTKLPLANGAFGKYLERAMGIEPTALAWEARVLPLYDARRARHSTRVSHDLANEEVDRPSESLSAAKTRVR